MAGGQFSLCPVWQYMVTGTFTCRSNGTWSIIQNKTKQKEREGGGGGGQRERGRGGAKKGGKEENVRVWHQDKSKQTKDQLAEFYWKGPGGGGGGGGSHRGEDLASLSVTTGDFQKQVVYSKMSKDSCLHYC